MVARRVLPLLVAVAVLMSGCGDDDQDESSEPDPSSSEDLAAYCQVAKDLNEADLPSAELLRQARDLAPAEIADDLDLAAGALLDAKDGDPASFIAIFAQDDVTEAAARIDAFGADRCGLEIDSPPVGDEGVESGSTEVDITSREYAFDVPEVTAGRVTFVLTNEGKEAHFLGVARLLGDATVEDALQADDPDGEGLTETLGTTGLAAPGGDEEYLVTDLTPGRYALFCFLPSGDGTPHAFLGMAQEVTVS